MHVIVSSDLSPDNVVGWTAATVAFDQAGYDLILFESGSTPPLDMLAMAAFVAPTTQRIGLGVTVDPTTVEPFTFARGLATLDHLSGGRAAWRVLGGVPGQASEFAELVAKLLVSWGANALVERHADGLLSDADAVSAVNHNGTHYFSRGPLNMPQPPQGVPPLVALSDDADRPATAMLLEDAAVRRCGLTEIASLSPSVSRTKGVLLRDRLVAA